MRGPTIPLILLLLSATALAQQGHDHATGANGEHFVVLHDLEPQGRAVVGSVSHFGFALVKDGMPVDHHDASFRLTQNGVTLFESADTHEYDGLFGFDYVFTTPGSYEVTAESDVGITSIFNGTAVFPQDAFEATLELSVPETVAAGRPAEFTLRVLDESGEIVDHSDVILEVRRVRDGLLVERVHAHTHTEPMILQAAFAEPGEYAVWAVGYNAFPTGRGPEFPAAYAMDAFQVTAPMPGAAASIATPTATGAVPTTAQDPGHAHALALALKIDPYVNVGPMNHVRLSGLVWNETAKAAEQHVDFEATLEGPTGVVFESASLHEYDGHFELLTAGLAPGVYTFHLTAKRGEWTAEDAMEFRVLPPVAPLGAGVNAIRIDGLDDVKAGVPTELTFHVNAPGDAAGVVHSEVDLTVFERDESRLLFNGKLHGHAGTTKATVTFPEAGTYFIRVDADPLFPSPHLYGDVERGIGATAGFTVDVAEGPGLPTPDAAGTVDDAVSLTVPAGGLLLVAGALAVAVLVAGRRRR